MNMKSFAIYIAFNDIWSEFQHSTRRFRSTVELEFIKRLEQDSVAIQEAHVDFRSEAGNACQRNKSYVRHSLGQEFTESKGTSLTSVFQDTLPAIPLIFVLPTGSDLMSALQKFAQEKELATKLHSISLSQGQGAAAD